MIDFHAQEVDDFGGITGKGLGNLLGAPTASDTETLLREAIQNSWDARLNDGGIRFDIEARTLDTSEGTFLWKTLLSNRPPVLEPDAGDTRVLVVRDHNTRGLAGPVRASDPPDANGRQDFVNFVYMVGETKPLEGEEGSVSGGTYGYGRSSFFRVSQHQTVLIHSRCVRPDKEPESRLIAMAWTDKYEKDGVKHTGRHWWGEEHEDDWLGPVVGSMADQVMEKLGIETAEGTGTTIVVLDPILDGTEQADTQKGQTLLANAIVRNCWPKIITDEIDFRLFWEGSRVELPEPERCPDLKLFVRAFRALHFDEDRVSTQQFPIWVRSRKNHVGQLTLSRDGYIKGRATDDGPLSNIVKGGPAHHVALMRNNLLLVKYLTGAEPAEDEQYGGVFITERDYEPTFARSEPPSHDDWVVNRLPKKQQTYVRVALRRIEKSTRKFAEPSPPLMPQQSSAPLAGLSEQLGELLPDTTPSLNSRSTGSTSSTGSSRPRTPTVTITDTSSEDAGAAIERTVEFIIDDVEPDDAIELSAGLHILTEQGARERKPPEGAAAPHFINWQFDDQSSCDASGKTTQVQLSQPITGGSITFMQPRNCMVEVALDANLTEEVT